MFASLLHSPLLAEHMGCIDKVCVRQLTGCSCVSRLVDSECVLFLFLGSN